MCGEWSVIRVWLRLLCTTFSCGAAADRYHNHAQSNQSELVFVPSLNATVFVCWTCGTVCGVTVSLSDGGDRAASAR